MFIPNSKGEQLLQWVAFLARETFKVSVVTFLLLYVLEDIKPSFVENFLSMYYFLWATILSGVVAVILQNNNFFTAEESPLQSKRRFHILNLICACVGAGLLYARIQDQGVMAIIIAMISGAVIYLITYYLYSYEQGEESA